MTVARPSPWLALRPATWVIADAPSGGHIAVAHFDPTGAVGAKHTAHLFEHVDHDLDELGGRCVQTDLAVAAVVAQPQYGGLVTQQWTESATNVRSCSRTSPVRILIVMTCARHKLKSVNFYEKYMGHRPAKTKHRKF